MALTRVGAHLVLDFWSSSEEPDDDWFQSGQLAALTPLRGALLRGDLSAAYLGWLLAVQLDEVGDNVVEPPVPGGLSALSAPLSALAEFLWIDRDLLRAAAEASSACAIDRPALHDWVKGLSTAEKARWLLRAADHPNEPVGAEIIEAFRRQGTPTKVRRRRAGELRARAEQLRQARERHEAVQHQRARARAETTRRKHLDGLAKLGHKAWDGLDKLVVRRKYDEAVRLTVDIRDAAERTGSLGTFEERFAQLRKRHGRRRGYLDAVRHKLRESSGHDVR